MSLKLRASTVVCLLGSLLKSGAATAATVVYTDSDQGRLILVVSKAERKRLIKVPRVNLYLPDGSGDSISCLATKLTASRLTLESDTEELSPWKVGLTLTLTDDKSFVPKLERRNEVPKIPEFTPKYFDPQFPVIESTVPFPLPGLPPQTEIITMRPLWRDDRVPPFVVGVGYSLFQNDLNSKQLEEGKATNDGSLAFFTMASQLRGYDKSALRLTGQLGTSRSQREGGVALKTKRTQADFSYERGFGDIFSIELGASLVTYEIPDALGHTSREGIVPFATFNFWFEDTRFGFSYIPSPPSRVKEADLSERNRYRLFLTHGGKTMRFFTFYDLRFADEQNPIKREDQLLQFGIASQGKSMQANLTTTVAHISSMQNQVATTSSDETGVLVGLSWLGTVNFRATAAAGAQQINYHDRAVQPNLKYSGLGWTTHFSLQQGF